MKVKKEIFKLPEKISGGGPAVMKDKKKKIVFLSATRTPFGEVGGSFKDLSPIDLGYYAARAVIEKAGMEDFIDLVDQSIFGNAQHTIMVEVEKVGN